MEERGAVLLDTEIILGDPELGYVGQPDKIWLMFNKQKTGRQKRNNAIKELKQKDPLTLFE